MGTCVNSNTDQNDSLLNLNDFFLQFFISEEGWRNNQKEAPYLCIIRQVFERHRPDNLMCQGIHYGEVVHFTLTNNSLVIPPAIEIPFPLVLLRRATHYEGKSRSRLHYLLCKPGTFTLPVNGFLERQLAQQSTDGFCDLFMGLVLMTLTLESVVSSQSV